MTTKNKIGMFLLASPVAIILTISMFVNPIAALLTLGLILLSAAGFYLITN